MDIKFEIEPVFKIEFFKIKCVNFKNKKAKIEEVLGHYPEMPFPNFYSNRNKARINKELLEIFKEEFYLIRTKFNAAIILDRAWSVTYNKGNFMFHITTVLEAMPVLFIYNKEKTHQKQLTYDLGIMKKTKAFYIRLKLNKVT